MDREDLTYFDGTREMLEKINTEPLIEDDGYIISFDLEYGVYEDNRGIFLVLIDLEYSYSWVDSIFNTWDEANNRIAEIKETLKDINLMDKTLGWSRMA